MVVQAVVVVRWKVVNTGRSNGRGRRQAGQAERASEQQQQVSKPAQQASKQAHSKAKRLRLTEAGAAAAPVLIAAEL